MDFYLTPEEFQKNCDDLAIHFGYANFKSAWQAVENGELAGTAAEYELKMRARMLGIIK